MDDSSDLKFSATWRKTVEKAARRFGMTPKRFVREAVKHFLAKLEGADLPVEGISLAPDGVFRQQAGEYTKQQWANRTPEQRTALQKKLSKLAKRRWALRKRQQQAPPQN